VKPSDRNYPLAASTWDDLEIEAATKVLQGGRHTMGDKVAEFERAFAAQMDVPYCVMVNSGSSANLLMAASLFYRRHQALKAGDEVLVPAVSWPTTYYPFATYGLSLRFVDVDLDTLNYDLDALEGAVTPRTKAIAVVNLLGNPNDFTRLRDFAERHRLVVLEDNCESLGAKFDGQEAGTFGIMGTTSCFFSHHISTMEGGLVFTRDEELHHILLCLRAHGWTRNLPKQNFVTGTKSDNPFEESFKFVLPGYNLRPMEIQGAIGLEQLKKLPGLVRQRRRNAEVFQKVMRHFPEIRIQKEIGESSWFGFSLIPKKDSGWDQKRLAAWLMARGIECRPIVAGNFTKNEVLRWLPHSVAGSLRNAEELDRAGLFVGNHGFDLTREIEYLGEVLEEALRRRPQVQVEQQVL
jgi:CDP-6-deoxy-D-xylo-4-hexulose-3-dehydrase